MQNWRQRRVALSKPTGAQEGPTCQDNAVEIDPMQTSELGIDDPLHADDVVHQSLGDRLLHGRHSELALGVLGVKDHRSPADAYDFRGIQSALSASCPLQAGPLARSQAWPKR